jgi:hypothetical protein
MIRGLLVLTFALLTSAVSYAVDVEPPKVQLTDRYGVNLANGQVTHSMGILSIGGAMGLSDSVSIYANEFNFLGYRAFNHKYFAQARDVNLTNSQYLTPKNIMRVYYSEGSADFQYYQNGQPRENGDFSTGISYVSVGDERQTLEVNGNFFEWTRQDGAVVRFARACASGSDPEGQFRGHAEQHHVSKWLRYHHRLGRDERAHEHGMADQALLCRKQHLLQREPLRTHIR